MIYKSKHAVNDIIIVEKILVLFFSFFKDLNNPIALITIAIKHKKPIREEII